MNPTLNALTVSLLGSESDDNGVPLLSNYSASDIDSDCLDRLYSEYCQFVNAVEKKITELIGNTWNSIDEFYDIAQPVEYQAEHDFIMTRNGHGCGFWDGDWSEVVSSILNEEAKKFACVNGIIGDDGKIYLY